MTKRGESERVTLDRMIDKRDILKALAHSRKDRQELTAAMDYSRSTVSRAINEFDDAGVIETRSRGRKHVYRLTAFGERVLEWINEGETLVRCRSMFAGMPSDTRFPAWLLTRGNVELTATRDVAKQEVFDQILAFISRADRFHVVASSMIQDETFAHLVTEVIENGLSVEMVFPEQCMETLYERFGAETRTLLREYDVSQYTLPADEVPFGFGVSYHERNNGSLVPGELAIICYDDHQRSATGTVVSDVPEAVAWGESRYEEYRERTIEYSETERRTEGPMDSA